jgi:hypothetical protein
MSDLMITAPFALAALIFFVARFGVLVALHLVPNPYHPITDAVSNYAVGSTKRLTMIMTWLSVGGWLALAGTVWFGESGWADRVPVTIMLIALAVIFAVLPYAPTDVEGKPTLRGRLHLILAVAWFALAYILTGDFATLADGRWGTPLAQLATGLHWAALVGLITALVIRPLRRWFGLAERVFIVAISLFYLVASAGLLLH